MPVKTPGEKKVVAFVSHAGGSSSAPLEVNRTDHVANTPHSRLANLTSNPHRSLSKMSVVLNPNRNLGFRRPLTQLVKRSLSITNTNTLPVAFKVKTTAPKLYCVRPNSGRVEPGETVEVAVMLQPLKEEPSLNAKCKDKFLVQSTFITPEKETMPLHELWATPEMSEDGNVFQQKLRVLYLPAEDQALDEEDEVALGAGNVSELHQPFETVKTHNGNGHLGFPNFTQSAPEDDEPLPNPHVVTRNEISRESSGETSQESRDVHPAQEVPILDGPAFALSPPPPASQPIYEQPVYEQQQPIYKQEEPEPIPIPPPVAVHVPPPPSTIETVYVENPLNVELLESYKKAQAQIEQLRAEMATMSVAPTSTIRSRRDRAVSDAGSDAETDVQTISDEPRYHRHHHQEGVPLQVVVIIALAVFTTTYLFF